MSGSAAARVLIALTLVGSTAPAQDQAPPLSPPELAPPSTSPVPSGPPPRTPRDDHRPMLLIPGVTAPRPTQRRPSPAPSLTPPPASRIPSPSAPVVLEPITEEDEPGPADRPAPAPPPSRPGSAATPAVGPSRTPSSILGRLAPGGRRDPGDSITVEPRSDPAAEAAVKRRVEAQARQAGGDRLRSVEVRVQGRTILVRAHASRFWHRRALRRSLENLPAPAGYRTEVEVVD